MNNANHSRILAAWLFAAWLLLDAAVSALAEVHYVDVNSTNATPPYTNWTTAATNIQDAVDAAAEGDAIVVTNGIYSTVHVDKPLNLWTVNGPRLTTIDGQGNDSCAYLPDSASLSGFTLTNGYSDFSGGGVYCEPTAVVSNCVITGNRAFATDAHSPHAYGGGAYGGTLNNCTLAGNSAIVSPAGASQSDVRAIGGGAAYCTLNNCSLNANVASAIYSVLTSGVKAYAYGGGAAYCTLKNCLLNGNSATGTNCLGCNDDFAYAYGGGVFLSTTRNCTLIGNSVSIHGIGLASGGGAFQSAMTNCIVHYNLGNYDTLCNLSHCCTTPMPTNGFGNITNAPLFVDTNGWADLRLQSNSPCINAGSNAGAPAGTDLDGSPRIAGGTVDIGAYEFQSPTSIISYAWLQQFNLPINPATDTADPDGDGVDNYHEWLAGTDPTNPFSSPAQLTITPSGLPPSGIILTWSTNAVGFTLQSTTNLVSPAVWATISPAQVVIGGQNVVTNPFSCPQQFYRLKQ